VETRKVKMWREFKNRLSGYRSRERREWEDILRKGKLKRRKKSLDPPEEKRFRREEREETPSAGKGKSEVEEY